MCALFCYFTSARRGAAAARAVGLRAFSASRAPLYALWSAPAASEAAAAAAASAAAASARASAAATLARSCVWGGAAATDVE